MGADGLVGCLGFHKSTTYSAPAAITLVLLWAGFKSSSISNNLNHHCHQLLVNLRTKAKQIALGLSLDPNFRVNDHHRYHHFSASSTGEWRRWPPMIESEDSSSTNYLPGSKNIIAVNNVIIPITNRPLPSSSSSQENIFFYARWLMGLPVSRKKRPPFMFLSWC